MNIMEVAADEFLANRRRKEWRLAWWTVSELFPFVDVTTDSIKTAFDSSIWRTDVKQKLETFGFSYMRFSHTILALLRQSSNSSKLHWRYIPA